MKTYQYHSNIYNGDVQVTYNQHGLLVGFYVVNNQVVEKVDLESGQLKNYVNQQQFLANAKKYNVKLIEIERNIAFEHFWEKYKQKECGRKMAETAWNKLSKAEQLQAYDFIPVLDSRLKLSHLAKPYATTYLNQKRWTI